MSSLATQLAARKTLDGQRLSSAKALKNPPSFIYTPKHASKLTTADLHSLAESAWDQLEALDPAFDPLREAILGQEARETDRALLSVTDNENLSGVIRKVLKALGPHVQLKPAGVVFEWLLRKFRVNDFDVAEVISLFLPYHTTPQFPSALNVVSQATLEKSAAFSPLVAARASLAPVPLSAIVATVAPFSPRAAARPFLDFILQLPASSLEAGVKPHRALIAFWLQFVAQVLERAGGKLPEGEQAAILSALLETLRAAQECPDMVIACCIAVARFAVHNPLSAESLPVVLGTMVRNQPKGDAATADAKEALITAVAAVAQLSTRTAVGALPVGALLAQNDWRKLLKVGGIGDLVYRMCSSYDCRTFTRALFSAASDLLLKGGLKSRRLLVALVTPQVEDGHVKTLPQAAVQDIAEAALAALVSVEDEEAVSSKGSAELVQVLQQVYQRHPETWEASVAATKDRSGVTAKLLEVQNKVLLGDAGDETISRLVLASTSADASLRVSALKELLDLHDPLPSDANTDTLKQVLAAHLTETDPDIVALLLSDKAQRLLVSLFAGKELLAYSEKVLEAEGVPEAVVTAHVSYLAGSFLDAHPDLVADVVERVFWHRLLLSRQQPKRAYKATSVLAHPWLAGADLSNKAIDQPTAILSNVALVDRIASNIAGLDARHRAHAIEHLVGLVRAGQHPGSLTLLVAASVAGKLRGAQQAAFATRLLDAADVEGQGGLAVFATVPKKVQDKVAGMEAADLAGIAYTSAPASSSATALTLALIFSLVRTTAASKDVAWSWLAGPTAKHEGVARLVLRLYRLSQSAGGGASSTWITNALFSSALSLDAVAFLASVWTSPTEPAGLKVASLRQAGQIVRALEAQRVDWQTVLPALFVALRDSAKEVRLEALETALACSSSAGTGGVYGANTIYGSSTDLVVLEPSDVKALFEAVASSRREILLDAGYLQTVAQRLMQQSEVPSSRYTAFVLSHIVAWPSLPARTSLLETLGSVTSDRKTDAMMALVKDLAPSNEATQRWLATNATVEQVGSYAEVVLRPLSAPGKKWVDRLDGATFNQLLDVVAAKDDNSQQIVVAESALKVLASLFPALRGELRVDLLKRLLRLASLQNSLVSGLLGCLRACAWDAESLRVTLVELLNSFATPVSKGAKRLRANSDANRARAERLPELLLLLENVDFGQVRATGPLMLSLFELLASLIDLSSSGEVDIAYSSQLLLLSLTKVTEKLTDGSSDSVRIAPVLDVMRASINPQIANLALLLLAQLAPIAPEQLAHNILPIFTFMGANVQRDDAYSLRVVERTLQSIVPALVKSARSAAPNREALTSALRGTLRVFTDAVSHVPRHRRAKLYTRFVETLGPRDFLAAIVLLLVDAPDASSKDAADGFELALGLFDNFPVSVELEGIAHLVHEAAMLVDPASTDAAFSEALTEDPSALPGVRRGQALVVHRFLAQLLSSKPLSSKLQLARKVQATDGTSVAIQEVVGTLSTLSISASSADDDLGRATQANLEASARLLPADVLSETLLLLLEQDSGAHVPTVLHIVQQCLPGLKGVKRTALSPAVQAVVPLLVHVLQNASSDPEEVLATAQTLQVLVEAAEVDVDPALTKVVPALVAAAQIAGWPSLQLHTVLSKLILRLGTRVIPFVDAVVSRAASLVDGLSGTPADDEMLAAAAGLGMLDAVVQAAAGFVATTQLDRILAICHNDSLVSVVDDSRFLAQLRSRVLASVSKHVSFATVVESIFKLYKTTSKPSTSSFPHLLSFLGRVLRKATAAQVSENLRTFSQLFLSAMDYRRTAPADVDVEATEDAILDAFVQLVLKLNEQAFRPLFLRLYDWAAVEVPQGETQASVAREIVLYRLMNELLVQLKAIVVPYFSFLVDHALAVLESSERTTDITLWTAVATALTNSLEFDDESFWSSARLARLISPLAGQLNSPLTFSSPSTADVFYRLLRHVALRVAGSEANLKALNKALLLQTRAEDLRVKLAAVEALQHLWEVLGDAMLDHVSESTPFLAEALEETEGGVEAATRKLVKLVESHLGEDLHSYGLEE